MKFREKPVIIEAVQLVKGMTYPDWLKDAIKKGTVNISNTGFDTIMTANASIETLEGTMGAVNGDWIIKGVKGEIYPCTPDIFEMTYDPVED